jgi:hypothetical protein
VVSRVEISGTWEVDRLEELECIGTRSCVGAAALSNQVQTEKREFSNQVQAEKREFSNQVQAEKREFMVEIFIKMSLVYPVMPFVYPKTDFLSFSI